MNVNHIWTIACRKSLLDQETNNLNLFDIMEEITLQGSSVQNINFSKVEKFGIPIEFEIISLWERFDINEPILTQYKIEQLSPSGKLINEHGAELRIEGVSRRLRTIGKVRGLELTGPGIYHFVTKVKDGEIWKEVGRIPLEIKLQNELTQTKK